MMGSQTENLGELALVDESTQARFNHFIYKNSYSIYGSICCLLAAETSLISRIIENLPVH
jgi:hypothetical protein